MSWYVLGFLTPKLNQWERSSTQVGNFSALKITWVLGINLNISSRLLVRRNFGNCVDKATFAYPDINYPVIIELPKIEQQVQESPKIEVKKYSRKRYINYVLAEDYKVYIEAWVE
ncbi:MAG: hypothetical protein F6K54_16160 [Okeania sp. SIO3B5]|uniref:hypothetical protein n=1 Tax=Okeania sp. SIO3B5 TaxID=2607811 RepID=UPI001400DD7D|nr:hypothetical protein [Okeania sp. SIO3B5]NEO54478.1 hypothetical protein [Okeania sp. SIO3B5]